MSDHELDLASPEDTLLSRVPLFDNPRKTDYLGYRACGFHVHAACDLVPIMYKTVVGWRKSDSRFAEFESNRLYELQKSIGPDLLRLEFLRNFKLVLIADNKVLNKAALLGVNVGAVHVDGNGNEAVVRAGLTEREYDYLKVARKNYSPQDLLALHRALEPESVEEDKGMYGKVVVVLNGEIIEGEMARRAAGSALLQQWRKNKEMLPESEVVEEDSA